MHFPRGILPPDTHIGLVTSPQSADIGEKLVGGAGRRENDLTEFGETGLGTVGDCEIENSRREAKALAMVRSSLVFSVSMVSDTCLSFSESKPPCMM